MKTIAILSLSLAACGSTRIDTRSETTPITHPNPAVDAAAAKSPPPTTLTGWPSSGAIDCNIVLDTRFSATYRVVVSSAMQRVAHVQFHDSFTNGDYSGDATFGPAEIGSSDTMVKRNADYAAFGVYELDFGRGHTRWWGFALDISTLTIYVNDAVLDQNPPIDAGWVVGTASTDCHYTP